MTTNNPTQRMIEFIDSPEAEEYAGKAQLPYAPALVPRDRQAVADKIQQLISELYTLFDDDQPIKRDVPDLDTVDWGQLADHLTIDKIR